MAMRWVLITGTSTGIGRATALRLAAGGHGVVAGVRRQEDAERLAADFATLSGASMGRLEPVILDVTKPETIRAAVERATQLAGADGLWALVNNAGIVIPGPVEHLSLDSWRAVFEVNLFGMIAMAQAALPLLRRGVAAHGKGVPRIAFLSSIGGRVAQPIVASYTASKFATTALSDSLRVELRRQGIGVTSIEPGAIDTAIWGKADRGTLAFGPDHPARALYGPEIDGVARLSAKTAKSAIPADDAARIIERALNARKAPAHVLIGLDAKGAAFLKRWLPFPWFEALMMRFFGIR